MNQTLFRMKRSGKIGTYTFILIAAVLAILVLLNTVASLLPAKITKFDTSGLGLTEISDESEKFLSGLKEDVTLYWLCEGGITDDQLGLLLTRYEEAGDRIKIEIVDTLENPTFASQFSNSPITDYSIIVASDRRFRVVDVEDLYYYSSNAINSVAGYEVPLSMSELNSIYTQYLYQGINILQMGINTYFRGESLLTAAIDFVSRETVPHAYRLTGHGDATPSKEMSDILVALGMDMEELNLSARGEVPADANCVVLYAPTTDLSDAETSALRAYLNRGGSLMLNTSPTLVESQPNIQSLAAMFGLSVQPGLLKDTQSGYYDASASTDVLVPSVSDKHAAAAYVKQQGLSPRIPQAHAIQVAEELPTGVQVTPILTTSDKGASLEIGNLTNTLAKGKMNVAVSAERSVATQEGTTAVASITWYGSIDAFTDTHNDASKGGNYYYYAATMNIMCTPFTSPYENLNPCDLSAQTAQLSKLTEPAIIGLGVVMVAVIPVGLLSAGIIIWIRRRRR